MAMKREREGETLTEIPRERNTVFADGADAPAEVAAEAGQQPQVVVRVVVV
jgi:hypothetical protein